MAVNIGPKIGIDGEAEFRKNLNSISQQLKTLGTEMKAVTSAFDANDKSQENLANQSQVLTAQMSLQEKRIKEIQKALDHARANYAENSNEVQRWQQAMNNAVTELNKTRSQLSRVQSEMDGTADATDKLSDALKEADGAAESASGGFNSMTVAMGNLISSGIQAAADAVANLVSSLWNLDESTEEYRRAQGRLNTAYEAAGYGAEAAAQAYNDFYAILGDTDTATEASQLLAQLANHQEDLSTWTRIAAGVSGTFGDSLPIEGLIEAANETAKVGEVTGTLADALNWVGIQEDDFNTRLGECSDESDRNQLIMDTLAETYDEAAEAFYRNNEVLIASRDAQSQLDEVTGKLGSTIANLKNELKAEFLPTLTQAADALNGLLTGELTLGEAFSQFADIGVQMVQQLLQGISNAVPIISEAAGMLFEYLKTSIAENLPTLMESGLNAVSAFAASLRENVGLIVDGAIALAQTLAQGLADSIPTIVERVPEIVSNIANTINDNAPKILKAAGDIILTLVMGLIEAIPTIVQNIPQIISAIVDTLLAFNWLNLGKTVVQGLAKGLSGAVSFVKDAANSIVTTIRNGISQLPQQMLTIGKNIVQGLWNGIKSMASWIKTQIKSFVGGIVSTVENLLGIHSPSKVFASMGENMALGLGQGFGGEMRDVQRQINRSMADLVTPSMTYGVTATSASTGGGNVAGDSIAAAIRGALDGVAVYLNGQRVGNLVTRQQNNTAIARGQSQVYI